MYKAHISGKRTQSCTEHCLNTAKYAENNAMGVGMSNTAYLSGLLHDMGKFSDDFCEYIEAAANGEKVVKGSIIHTFAGVKTVIEKYHCLYNNNITPNSMNNLTAEIIAIAIGSHHGLFDCYNENGKSGLQHRVEKQPQYDIRARNAFFKECVSEDKVDRIFETAVNEIELIVNKCIELSGESSEEVLFYLGLIQRLICSAVIDGDRRDTAEFMDDNKQLYKDYNTDSLQQIWKNAITSLEYLIDSFAMETDIQRVRREMSDYCAEFAEKEGDIYRLSLPTGAGKTLTSLRYALIHAKKYKKKRIIFAVPLLSVLDQNAQVIKEAVSNDEIILEHHSNIILDSKSSEECEKQELLVDTWDSPIIITTLVQLLNTMFDGKTSSIRRFHNLSDSVIVIDEVQSVPENMISLFNLAINFLSGICNSTILLCSATQPLLELNSHKLKVSENNMIPKEKMEEYKQFFKRNTAKIEGELEIDDIVDLAKRHLASYNSVLIVCNTKKEAADLFNGLRNEQYLCFHLSTGMCMSHRKNVLQTIRKYLSQEIPMICVSTQLIEAGVDVSFGSVIRIMAGIDNIVQAAGRCNRNYENGNDAPVSIVSLKRENLSKLKEIKRCQDVTGELITAFNNNPNSFDNDILSDKSIAYYYQSWFRKVNSIIEHTEYYIKKLGVSIFELLAMNEQYLSTVNDIYTTINQAFKTAGEYFEVFDNNQKTIIVPYAKGEEIINRLLFVHNSYDISYMKDLLNEAKEYSVNVFQYQIDILQKVNALYTDDEKKVLILNPEFYDEELGIIYKEKEASEWDTLIL